MAKSKKTHHKSDAEYALAYSTDPTPLKHCSGCSRPIPECVCKKGVVLKGVKPAVYIERKGRAGKSVTVVTKLPAHETFLKELSAYLKQKLGTGGTHYVSEGQGVLEIHGEKSAEVLALIVEYNQRLNQLRP